MLRLLPGLARTRFLTLLTVAALGSLAAAAPAGALTFTLDTEFDAGVVGPHATVTVTESGGGLDFEVSLVGSDLGPGADLHVFYFNLAGDPTNVTLSSTAGRPPNGPEAAAPALEGGSGADRLRPPSTVRVAALRESNQRRRACSAEPRSPRTGPGALP